MRRRVCVLVLASVRAASAQSQLAGVDMTDPRRAAPPVTLTQIKTMAKNGGAGGRGSKDESRRAQMPAGNQEQDPRRAEQIQKIKHERDSMFHPSDYARRITDFEDGLISMELQPQPNDPEHELRDMNGDDADTPMQEPPSGTNPFSMASPWAFGGASAANGFGMGGGFPPQGQGMLGMPLGMGAPGMLGMQAPGMQAYPQDLGAFGGAQQSAQSVQMPMQPQLLAPLPMQPILQAPPPVQTSGRLQAPAPPREQPPPSAQPPSRQPLPQAQQPPRPQQPQQPQRPQRPQPDSVESQPRVATPAERAR